MENIGGDRNKVQHATQWVRPKSARALLVRELRKQFGQAARAAEEIAEESLAWMGLVQGITLPGCVRMSVPATSSRRYAPLRRRICQITAVDVDEDAEVWQEYGLAVMQRRRLTRWIYEIYRQGGYASLTELAAWANLTPTALEHRLKPVREMGIWLPHVGGPQPNAQHLALEPWLVRRYLEQGSVDSERALLGISEGAWRRILRRFAQAAIHPLAAGPVMGFSLVETEQLQALARYAQQGDHMAGLMQELMRDAFGAHRDPADNRAFSPAQGQRYLEWLGATVEELGLRSLGEGELLFYAMAAEEGAGARMRSARIVPVRLQFFTQEDALAGYRGASRRRVFELKFGRIRRFTNEAWNQSALLSLPDLGLLMGMHTAAIRRKIAAHEGSFVPTRGRVWNIGARPTAVRRMVRVQGVTAAGD
ncbi:MAG: DUF1670 domain-containing protein [Thermaerobacter sp.]|nr:DUF1670 domain-containing protein [Thermaerobacter sp.]